MMIAIYMDPADVLGQEGSRAPAGGANYKPWAFLKIDPDGKGRDMIQYRCDCWGRIERLRLIRRTWPSARQTRR
jgi:hypothetical protein